MFASIYKKLTVNIFCEFQFIFAEKITYISCDFFYKVLTRAKNQQFLA